MAKIYPLEHRIEYRFVSRAIAAGFLVLKLSVPGGRGRRGYPDRLVLGPKTRLLKGRICFVEFKRSPKNKPTPLQQKIHDDLRARGYQVAVVDSIQSCDALLALIGATSHG